eukprot:Macronucleus_8858.p1 GENE.Macronucleus_8858~~Macronucleus_8858.p1  ORF type:complete len:112 (+),score=27.19 Macronucleus_8858:1-336(+)
MPQRTLFYRFLNTIIDDLFSFIITMPTMHRISCFRDDAVFLVYLYQRYAYKVDKTRGAYATEKKQVAAEGDQAEEQKAVASEDASNSTSAAEVADPKPAETEAEAETKKDR